MADPREKKSCIVGSITTETIFTNFDSLLLIDAGATNGFTLTDDAGHSGAIPTGIPISIGKTGSPSAYLKVGPTGATAMNVTYILYQ